jgi:hypothetical protein
MMDPIAIAGLLIAVVGVVVAVPRLQRWLRLAEPTPQPPHQLPGIDMTLLRADPVVAPSIAAAEARGAALSFCHRHQLGEYRIKHGYVPFLTPDGAECQYATPTETLVLVVKERDARR